MKAEHRELEVKFGAGEVTREAFRAWCFARGPSKYLRVAGPDIYYVQGGNVLRHRQNGEGAGELTVKRRTSKRSTLNRLEVDLRFDGKTTIHDVETFLEATGWTKKFTVVKDCDIFWFSDKTPGIEAVLYTVRCIYPNGNESPLLTFMEFEVHKADSSHPKAISVLSDWKNAAEKDFSLMPPTQQSLYEIYSGEKYLTIKEKKK